MSLQTFTRESVRAAHVERRRRMHAGAVPDPGIDLMRRPRAVPVPDAKPLPVVRPQDDAHVWAYWARWRPDRGRVMMCRIVEAVAEEYKVDAEVLRTVDSRKRRSAGRARHVAMYLAITVSGASVLGAARYFSCDHATIIRAGRVIGRAVASGGLPNVEVLRASLLAERGT